ncbi:MAG: SH3 domain-containing protein [Candidatus Omnitrophota bacterium]
MWKRAFFLSLGVCLLADGALVYGAPGKSVQKFPFVARVAADRVHVRAGQSNNYESVVVVAENTELLVLGKIYSWYKVALPDGAGLFVSKEYVKAVSPDIGEITADRVNVRARPGTEASILGQLLRGDQFFIKGLAGEKSDWYLIRPVTKASGWVQESFLEFKSLPVAGRNYVDVPDSAARVKADRDVLEHKHAEKFLLVKALTQGQYEAEGVLVPVAGLNPVRYKLMGGVKGDICVAYVSGTGSVLENFVGAKVVVRGIAKDESSLDAVVVTATKVSLSL